MRHAIRPFLLAVVAVALTAIGADGKPTIVSRINGIGLIDYSHKPTFKVGDWVRYRMTGKSDQGFEDDYAVTVLIAGEEDFWGDPCFWIETWTDVKDQPPTTTAALMSYSIFRDTSAIQRIQMYMRKQIMTLDPDGTPREELNKAASSTFNQRREVKRPVRWSTDTLGVDTVMTPKGVFNARKIVIRQGLSGTATQRDSSIYTEVRETRTVWFAEDVPITHIAREDLESGMSRRSWMLGKSESNAKLNVLDEGRGTARLLDLGHGGSARILPLEKQTSFAQQGHPPKVGPAAAAAARRPAKR